MQTDGNRVIGFLTTNTDKLREIQGCLDVLISDTRVMGIIPEEEVEETGSSFCENALIKLNAGLLRPFPDEITHLMAEDAGLIIDILDGRFNISPFPGIVSDRWFSIEVQKGIYGAPVNKDTYREKNRALLKLMEGQKNRKARYEACLSLWERRTNKILTATGAVDLEIAAEPRGEEGFGYDPIVIPVGYDLTRTMAELSLEEKSRISHRYHALNQLLSAINASSSGYYEQSGHLARENE